jgi:hypothetical protein
MRVAKDGGKAFSDYKRPEHGEQARHIPASALHSYMCFMRCAMPSPSYALMHSWLQCDALAAHAAAVAAGEQQDKSNMLDELARAPAPAPPPEKTQVTPGGGASKNGGGGSSSTSKSSAGGAATASAAPTAAPAASDAPAEAPRSMVDAKMVLKKKNEEGGGLVLTIIDTGGQPVFSHLRALFFTAGSTLFIGAQTP